MTVALDLEAEVLAAVAGVDDPEYPGVSIVDLGLLERIEVADAADAADGTRSGTSSATGIGAGVRVDLVPTFAGCPALDMIAGDVEHAVRAVAGVGDVEVRWVHTSTWTPDRLSLRARDQLAEAFTVAVEIAPRRARCPRCGSPTDETSMFGPSRCRSVHRCDSCRETIEVMRS